MKRFLLRSLPAAAFVLLASWLLADEPKTAAPKSNDDVQDFVFLAEARPLLVRMQVRVDGKPLSAAWDDFMKYMFAYLDINGDGVLSQQEAERAPRADQLARPLSNQSYSITSRSGPAKTDLDADKDGTVSRAELSAYYRKNGLPPFQFQYDSTPNGGLGLVLFYGGSRPDPEVAKVSQAIFALLDTDKDGKLTQKELAAAPALLLARDENEDEIISAQEVVPVEKPKGDKNGAMMRMMGMSQNAGANNPYLVPIPVSGQAPPELAQRMRERYDPSANKARAKPFGKASPAIMMPPKPKDAKSEAKPKAKTAVKEAKKEKKEAKAEPKKEEKKEPPRKLTRRQLRLDEATFARLDADKNGGLDDKELAAFVRRDPDLCLIVSFGDKGDAPLTVAPVKGPKMTLADKIHIDGAMSRLDLDLTRLDLERGEDKKSTEKLQNFAKTQFGSLFKQADKDNNGYLDEKEAKGSPIFGDIFKQIDRDGDGKIYEKELLAYFDGIVELERRAAAGCATLVLRDRSRGLFDLLDSDRDGRLSVREIKQAPKLLAAFDRDKKGYLRKDDIPSSYRLTLRRGLAKPSTNIQEAIIISRIFGNDDEETKRRRGPAWFRKMDRNRDGDISPKEFLFGDELFRQLDADGDGLISVEEAEKAGRDLSHRSEPRP
jgi:Ca2+-binding EF-hand superfamily protein